VLRRVERLASRESLPGYARQVAEMSSALLAAGLDVAVLAGFVARLNDALVRRALGWAEADLGPAPAPYAWLVFGAEGRMEQTLVSDRENGLVFGAAGERSRGWFEALAERVNADLTTAGFPESAAGRTARLWNGTLLEWRERVDETLDSRAHDAGVYFDLRVVGGDLDVRPLEELLASAGARPGLVRRLARAALAFRPPPSLVVRVPGQSVDLKLHGILPIALLARCYAVELGHPARATVERLEAARAAGILSDQAAATLSGAYRFLLELRLRTDLRQLSAGEAPVDELPLAALSPIERNRLKDVLRAIASWQEKAAHRYHVERG
jgi:CBS domain-containing protein